VIDYRDEIGYIAGLDGPGRAGLLVGRAGITSIAVYGWNQINAPVTERTVRRRRPTDRLGGGEGRRGGRSARRPIERIVGGRREIVRDNVTFYDVTFDLCRPEN